MAPGRIFGTTHEPRARTRRHRPNPVDPASAPAGPTPVPARSSRRAHAFFVLRIEDEGLPGPLQERGTPVRRKSDAAKHTGKADPDPSSPGLRSRAPHISERPCPQQHHTEAGAWGAAYVHGDIGEVEWRAL